uniref:Fibronectin type-III domain-containing protein n=1 Tax=Heterorhabditis bacteriophora TaxID=37862 RepID=A0A1I7XHC3_HETBA
MVDWSDNVVAGAAAYILDYSPLVGFPSAGSSLDSTTSRVFINGTVSAAEYIVSLSAVMTNGKRRNITEKIVYSKYYPEDHEEYSNTVETTATNVRLRGLDAGTVFRMTVRSIYKGIQSQDVTECSFRTEGTRSHDYSHFAETFTVRTLPPDFDLSVVTTSSYGYSKDINNGRNITEYSTTSSALKYSYNMSTSITTSTDSSIAGNSTMIPTLMWTQLPTTTSIFTNPSNATLVRTLLLSSLTTPLSNYVSRSSIFTRPPPAEAGIDEYKTGEEVDTLISVKEIELEYGEPGEIEMSQEGNLIRLDWSVPEGSLCDAYFLNYTILSLDRPKSFSIATPDDHTMLKLFPEHTLDLRVFCMLAGGLSKTWWAHRIAHMSKPKSVEGLHIVHVETDEFYVSRISVDWKWSTHHDFNRYKLVVSCKSVSGQFWDTDVYKFGPVVLDKLEPAQLYTISVRNESTELNLHSKAVEIEQITHPLKVNHLYSVVGREYVILYWDIENFVNNDCHFRLSYHADKIPTISVDLKGASRHRFTGLVPDVYYTFTITVIMGTGKATAESESEMVTIYIPNGRLSPSLQRQGSRELLIQFEYDRSVFPVLNGALDNFAVIVSDDSTNDDNYELRSWFEVRNEEVWGSYRASPSNWNPFSEGTEYARFTIGTDDCVRINLDEPNAVSHATCISMVVLGNLLTTIFHWFQ